MLLQWCSIASGSKPSRSCINICCALRSLQARASMTWLNASDMSNPLFASHPCDMFCTSYTCWSRVQSTSAFILLLSSANITSMTVLSFWSCWHIYFSFVKVAILGKWHLPTRILTIFPMIFFAIFLSYWTIAKLWFSFILLSRLPCRHKWRWYFICPFRDIRGWKLWFSFISVSGLPCRLKWK